MNCLFYFPELFNDQNNDDSSYLDAIKNGKKISAEN